MLSAEYVFLTCGPTAMRGVLRVCILSPLNIKDPFLDNIKGHLAAKVYGYTVLRSETTFAFS